jgi:hypothetical protein
MHRDIQPHRACAAITLRRATLTLKTHYGQRARRTQAAGLQRLATVYVNVHRPKRGGIR